MILVTGSTGRIGRPLVWELVRRRVAVRALVHGSANRSLLPAKGLQVLVGDLRHQATVNTAVAGVDRVFVLSPVGPDLVVKETALIRACERHGVARVVKLSALQASPDWPVPAPRWHGEVEEVLRQSGMAWTMLRPNFFLQTLVGGFLPPIGPAGELAVPAGEVRISMVDTRDIAAVAACVLTEDGHPRAAYELTGPRAVSFADVASALVAASGRQVHYVTIAPERESDRLRGAGVPPALIEQRMQVLRSYREAGPSGYPAKVTTTVKDITGTAPRTLEAFAAESWPRLLDVRHS